MMTRLPTTAFCSLGQVPYLLHIARKSVKIPTQWKN